jgi:hypothetical protein
VWTPEADQALAQLEFPWARYLGGYQDRLLGGPLGLPGLRYTAPEGVKNKDYTGVVLDLGVLTVNFRQLRVLVIHWFQL